MNGHFIFLFCHLIPQNYFIPIFFVLIFPPEVSFIQLTNKSSSRTYLSFCFGKINKRQCIVSCNYTPKSTKPQAPLMASTFYYLLSPQQRKLSFEITISKTVLLQHHFFIHSSTHIIKFVVLSPVRSAFTCCCPQTVAKSTDSTSS